MGDTKANLHQKLAWATADRADEAEALAERAEVDPEDARVAVERAHGERRDAENADPDSEMATVQDARRAAREND